jgi:predicted ATPase
LTVVSPSAFVLDGLSSLVDKSLLRVEDVPDDPVLSGVPRFAMLETIREFGAEQLAASDDEAGVRRAHEWRLALAGEAPTRFYTPEAPTCLERLEIEHGNLRTALIWSLVAGDTCRGRRTP